MRKSLTSWFQIFKKQRLKNLSPPLKLDDGMMAVQNQQELLKLFFTMLPKHKYVIYIPPPNQRNFVLDFSRSKERNKFFLNVCRIQQNEIFFDKLLYNFTISAKSIQKLTMIVRFMQTICNCNQTLQLLSVDDTITMHVQVFVQIFRQTVRISL